MSTAEKVSVDRFEEKITEHLYRYYCEELGLTDWEERVRDRINEVPRNETILKIIESFTFSLKGKKVLVVGSGWGGACAAAMNLGASSVTGIDVDLDANQIANQRMVLEGYCPCCIYGEAERLPFGDGEFDYVHCVTVLEHVRSVEQSLSEMIRVTKKGGYVFIQAPNYLRPIERHYKIMYVPLMPEPLFCLYLKLRGRPHGFIKSINYIWPGRVRKMLASFKDVEVMQIADEYERRAAVIRPPDLKGPAGNTSITALSQEKAGARSYYRKVLNYLAGRFLSGWDFVFRTREIYFLIKKY